MTKICTKCKTEKIKTEFYKRTEMRDKLTPWCKKCINKCNASYSLTDKGKLVKKRAKLRYNFNMSIEEFKNLKIRQGYKCKVCNKSFSNSKQTHIDHCHKTGKIRGVLCSSCNTFIGKLEKRIENNLLKTIFEYINHAN